MVLGDGAQSSRSSDYPQTEKVHQALVQKHIMQECMSASTPMTEVRLKKYICEMQALKD